MAAFPIITQNSPAVSITTDNSSLSYEQILYTLNQTAYYVKRIDMQANDINQLVQPFTYTKPNADGQLYSVDRSPVVDMYQFSAALNDYTGDFVLDALTSYGFTLLPNETLIMMFFTDSVSFIYMESVPEVKINRSIQSKKREYLKNGELIAVSIAIGTGIILILKTAVKSD